MIELIEDLTKIATPDAAEALVPFLWHPNESLRFRAAWSLAELFLQNDITEALQEIELTAEQKNNTEYLDWIWQPFNNSSSQNLSIIAGRIVYLLDKTSIESIPSPMPKLDPRLIIPLLSIHNLADFQSNSKWNSLADLLLEQQEQTPEINQKIVKQVYIILGTQSHDSPWEKILSSLKPRLQLALLSRLINRRRPNIYDWRNLFLEIQYKFQSSYHYLLVIATVLIFSIIAIIESILLAYRQPDNLLIELLRLAIYLLVVFWIFLWRGIEEKLEPNTFIRFGLLGILTFGIEIQRLLKKRLVWVGISNSYESIRNPILIICVFALIFALDSALGDRFALALALTSSFASIFASVFALAFADDGSFALAFARAFAGAFVLALVAGIISLDTNMSPLALAAAALMGMGAGAWNKANNKIDWTRFLAILAFPYFCSFPIVVVFSTLFMLRYLTWQYTALIWFIVFGTCTALWRYGQDKERKASNPLKGILDVAK
ncbi:MAG: hypothetical protein AAGA80_17995 [Cyanobacteria bacterium P01_F01_bin.143]